MKGNKIQLLHPAGKHAFKIDETKYEMMSSAILYYLKDEMLTHKQLHEAVLKYFQIKEIKFEGSVEWYMEGVKLDLEARKLIERFKENVVLKFCRKKLNTAHKD